MELLELLRGQVAGPLMERMGGLLGLDASQAREVGQAVLPAQVAVVRQMAGTEAGSRQLLDLIARVPQEAAQSSLETPEGLAQVRQTGTALLPQLMGERLDGAVQQVSTQTGAGKEGVLGMMQMIAPLVLGLVGREAGAQGLGAASLGSLFTDAGAGAAGLGVAGASAVGLGAAAGNARENVGGMGADLGAAAGPTGPKPGLNSMAGLAALAPNPEGRATVSAGAGLGGGMLHTNPALGGRRGLGLLWLLPLLLLLLLGGCFLLTGKSAEPFTLISPANASAVTGAFAVKGTGTAGHEVTVSENGQPVSKATVAEDGTYSADIPAPSAGDHTYALTEAGAAGTLALTVKAAEAAAASAQTDATSGAVGTTTDTATTGTATADTATATTGIATTDAATTGTATTDTATTGATTAAGAFAVTSPAAGTTQPAGAFDLKGTGTAGDVLEIFEDGVSLGKVTVGADGTWNLNVPSPAAGAHTYTVKGPSGTELGSFQTTVAASAAGTATADCTKTFSLSIQSGQTVAEPFRFGGVGSGKSYTVTVLRGGRQIGSKVLPLDGTCGYSYTSKPGKGTITYSVAQTGSADAASKITLTVK